jgi:hypothetical protein
VSDRDGRRQTFPAMKSLPCCERRESKVRLAMRLFTTAGTSDGDTTKETTSR